MSTIEHGFKAEVQQILNLMIHSVYSDREVFLRELISNAADALDKVRFTALTRTDLLAAEQEESGIRITVNAEAGVVVLEDDGIGMTEDEVIQNLGTIAHSGTKAFLEQLKAEGDGSPDLIGQFGLGFYSAFMVADEVEVETRSALPDSAAVKWRSKGQGTYEIEKGDRDYRGTKITLFLREDSSEFGEKMRLENIVRKHSNFLTWPIQVDGEQANSGKALWAEQPSQVTTEEANAFYKSIAMDWRDPALKIHVSVDSPLQYQALLFIPSDRPFDLFQPEAPKGPRLYARRVMIDEHAEALLPDWLRFVRGVVDSEDIPLNVSREMVQKTPVVRKIKDALTKRVLKDLKKFATRSDKADKADKADPDAPNYNGVWRNFGSLLKEAYYHQKAEYGDALLPLFRFNTLLDEDDQGLRSLDAYKSEMTEEQDTIWYLTAESREAALASPHLEAFRKHGWNVLLLTDPVDEWLTNVLPEFDGVTLKSVSRGELELEDEADDEEKADLTAFAPWVKDLLGDLVSDVRTSTRLTDSAVVLVDGEDGMTANMERILRGANQDMMGPGAKRALEVNPRHPLIKNLAELHDSGRGVSAEPIVRMLYDDALLLEGAVKDPAAMGRRLQDILVVASSAALGSTAPPQP